MKIRQAQWTEFYKTLNAENSDLYDVLAHVAFHLDILERKDRTNKAKVQLANYDLKQQEFLNFVLSQYDKEGVEKLNDIKTDIKAHASQAHIFLVNQNCILGINLYVENRHIHQDQDQ